MADISPNASPASSIIVSSSSHRIIEHISQYTQRIVLRYLCHLLPILSPSFVPPTTGKIMKKVLSELDFFLPFHQHAPSLANARREIYADIGQFPGEDGVGLFNVLAFRGVFFGSPFAQCD